MSIEARLRVARPTFELDVELSIGGRGVTAVFGPSGSGKTTLLRAIAGLEPDARGVLRVGAQVWQEPGRFVPPHRRAVGYVFQEASLFEHLSVRGNVEYGRKRSRGRATERSVAEAIEWLGVAPLLERRPHELSGGERQRVAIARALATGPAMLLLDEPLASLDERSKREILPYLESVHRELAIPVVLVSHTRDEVARLADDLVLLERGRVVAAGPMGEVFARTDLDLAGGADAETVLEGVVSGYDESYRLLTVDFAGGHFVVAGGPLPLGRPVRVQVMSRDVSLTLERQRDTSILNILPVVVDQLVPAAGGQMTVRVMAGPIPLLARITRKSAEALDLKVGDRVHAQVKGVALLL